MRFSVMLWIAIAVLCLSTRSEAGCSIGALRLSNSDPEVLSVNPGVGLCKTNRMVFGLNIVQAFPSQQLSAKQIQLIGNLHPAFLRIPAGYNANHYHWHSGIFSLPGRLHEEPNKISINDMFNMAKKLGVPVSYVINMNDSVDSINDLVNSIKKSGYNISYWELGNEVNQKSNLGNLKNFDGYYKKSVLVRKVIQSYFPRAKVALVGGSALYANASWNIKINEQSQFDRIILHRYFGPTKKENEVHKRYSNIKLMRIYRSLANKSKGEFLKWYSTFFPDKKYWISEYGVTYIRTPYQNSMGHAIWLAGMLITMLRDPSVEMAAYWNANAWPFALVTKARGSKPISRATMPYYAYAMLSSIAKRFPRTTGLLQIKGRNTCIDAQLFSDAEYVRSSGALAIYLINRCAKSVKLKYNNDFGSLYSVRGISADTPLASGIQGNVREQSFLRPWKHSSKDITIPGYAVGEINFIRNK